MGASGPARASQLDVLIVRATAVAGAAQDPSVKQQIGAVLLDLLDTSERLQLGVDDDVAPQARAAFDAQLASATARIDAIEDFLATWDQRAICH